MLLKSLTKILGSIFFWLYINNLPDYAIFNIIIYAYDTLQSRSKCDQASDYGQQLGA